MEVFSGSRYADNKKYDRVKVQNLGEGSESGRKGREGELFRSFRSSGPGPKIYFIPAAVTDEMCEPELEEGSSNAVYTYWRSTTGSWEFHDKLWCKHACTALPFDLAFLSNEPCVSAAKMLCELKGHRGFSHGGKNIYFIPGEISDSKCEEELEEGFNQYIYTCVRSGWHTVDEVMVTAEEPDMLIIDDAAS